MILHDLSAMIAETKDRQLGVARLDTIATVAGVGDASQVADMASVRETWSAQHIGSLCSPGQCNQFGITYHPPCSESCIYGCTGAGSNSRIQIQRNVFFSRQ